MITLPTAANQATEYEDFYESTLSQPVGVGDADIYPTTLPTSEVGFLVIDPLGTTPEIILYTSKGANYVRVPSVADGEGRGVGNTTPRPYEQGTKIGMYSIAEYFEGLANGRFMRDGFLQSRHFSSAIDPNSWIGTGEAWNYVGNNGQKEYQYVTAGDKTTKYQKGMKLRLPRVVAAPTQAADFESTSSQYASRSAPAGLTFTDDFTCEAWVKLESYSQGGIVSRYAGTNGFIMFLESDGRVTARGYANPNWRGVTSYQTIPLNQWVHIAATNDMSGNTGAIYINGVSVPVNVASGGAGTAALTQAGNLQVGAFESTSFFDGKIQDVRVWSSVRSATQIRDNMHRYPVDTTSLVSHFKLDGNFNDSTANANHLTGIAGAVATNVDNPLNAIEFGILTGLSFAAGNTTMTLWTGKKYNAPYENLSGIGYSAAANPYGFDSNVDQWSIDFIWRTGTGNTPNGGGWSSRLTGSDVVYPAGAWEQSSSMTLTTVSTNPTQYIAETQWNTAVPTIHTKGTDQIRPDSAATFSMRKHRHFDNYDLAVATTFGLYSRMTSGSGTQEFYIESGYTSVLTIKSAYI